MFSPRIKLARPTLGTVLRGALVFSLLGCGGQVDADGGATGGGGIGGVGGTGGTGAAGGTGATGGAGGSGWTECSTPDWAVCGTPECPEGRPGCSLCFPAKGPGLFGICAETFPTGAVPWKAADGKIFVGLFPTIDEKPGNILEAPFSAGVFLAAHGQAARVAYADRGVWTGDPLPLPDTCPSIADVTSCGGNCGGCPSGQICTGRSPLHPYGICVPTDSYCSLNPDDPGLPCDKADDCFVFKVEPDRQPAADAWGFCLPKAICAASAAKLPGGGRCE